MDNSSAIFSGMFIFSFGLEHGCPCSISNFPFIASGQSSFEKEYSHTFQKAKLQIIVYLGADGCMDGYIMRFLFF